MHKNTPPLASGALPLIGHALAYRNNREDLFVRGYEEHGRIFALKLAMQNVAVLIGPEYQRQFFLETDKSLGMEEPYKFLQAIFGEVAFLASHETYLEQRPILHAPFKREKMLRYTEIMQEQVQSWLDTLGDEGEIELTAEVNRLVQDIAGYALMGAEFQVSVGREFWDLYADLSEALDPLLPPHWPLPKFRRRDRAKARMIEILRPVIAERRQHPERYDDFLQDFVNSRYDDGREVDDDTIISLILALNFAGHETTAGQAAWTIIQILQHPEYRRLVEEEIYCHLPPGAAIDARKMRELRHIAWAVRETERTRPSADMVMRYAKEDLEVGDYLIPSGWLVQTTATVAHNLTELFPDPEAYDPLRYSPERREDKQDRFALIGFGGGTHKCAGMNFANNEMLIATALLLQQFELELVTPNPQIVYGLGANRPSKTIIRYHRRPLQQPAETNVKSGAIGAACPHHEGVAAASALARK